MTSWIRVSHKKTEEKERPFFFQTDEGDIPLQFTNYLYAYMYARNQGRPLTVYDSSNSISANYSLLKSTFQDVDGVTFVDSVIPSATALGPKQQGRLIPFLTGLSVDQLRAASSHLFQWNTPMKAEIFTAMEAAKLPSQIDACIHLRPLAASTARGVPQVNMATYLSAVRQTLKGTTNKAPALFVIAESPAYLEEFRKGADPSWKIYSLASRSFDINRPTTRSRVQQYVQFLAEINVALNSTVILSTLSSPVGRFLFLMSTTEQFKSLDTAVLTFY